MPNQCFLCFFLWFLFSATAAPAIEQNKKMRIHFLNVGYADAILLELPDRNNILIDAGTAESASFIKSYLQAQKITELDLIIITHAHDNHYGGAKDLLKEIKVNKFYFNGDVKHIDKGFNELMNYVLNKGIKTEILQKGQRVPLKTKKVSLFALSPDKFYDEINANSIALLLAYGNIQFVFTSDILPEQQDIIASEYPQIKNAQIIQIPHHGGDIAPSFRELINSGTKKDLIVSTGKNMYGMPKNEELANLKGDIYRTDLNGTLLISSDGNKVELFHEK